MIMKVLGILALSMFCVTSAMAAEPELLTFSDLYGKKSALGLQFSDKVTSNKDKKIRMRGFMAPPLKAEAAFFVLTREPVALCPFCSSDADWPDNIMVVYLEKAQEFVQFNATIEVEGMLEVDSHLDEETGFVSQLRLKNAVFRKV